MKAWMNILLTNGTQLSTDAKEVTQEEIDTGREELREKMLDNWSRVDYLDVPIEGRSRFVFTKYIMMLDIETRE
jgi:hypothetical protein